MFSIEFSQTLTFAALILWEKVCLNRSNFYGEQTTDKTGKPITPFLYFPVTMWRKVKIRFRPISQVRIVLVYPDIVQIVQMVKMLQMIQI